MSGYIVTSDNDEAPSRMLAAVRVVRVSGCGVNAEQSSGAPVPVELREHAKTCRELQAEKRERLVRGNVTTSERTGFGTL